MTTVYSPGNVASDGAIPVYITSGGGSGGYTPKSATASTITTGGTAITAITGPITGGYVTNPPNLASQGIAAAENAYLDMVGTPGSTDSAGNGTTTILTPGQTFSLPSLATGVTVKLNAATTGHKFTIEVW